MRSPVVLFKELKIPFNLTRKLRVDGAVPYGDALMSDCLCHFNKPLYLAEQRLHLFWSAGIFRHSGVFARALSFLLQSQQQNFVGLSLIPKTCKSHSQPLFYFCLFALFLIFFNGIILQKRWLLKYQQSKKLIKFLQSFLLADAKILKRLIFSFSA